MVTNRRSFLSGVLALVAAGLFALAGPEQSVIAYVEQDAFSARGCGRQHKAWGEALAEPQEYGVNEHRAREAGGGFSSGAISSSSTLGGSLPPASRARAMNSVRTWGSAALHPRLYSAARYRGLTAQEPVVYICPMHPDVSSKIPGQCPKCNMKLVAAKSAAEGADFYACPMHPDVMSNQAGVCPKCNMKLVKSAPPETSEYVVRIKTNPAPPKAGEKVKLQFTILHPVTEKPVREFNILHDMPFHLFVVSQDFEVFQHIHPDKQPDGSFTIETDLPKAGYYKIFCDFFPAGGMPQVTFHNLVTAGYAGDLVSSQAKLTPDKPVDNKLVRTVESTRFELKFDPEQPFVGKPAELHYHLVDEKTGAPVKDLKPYLGAWGHTLILSEDATDYLHSHPTEMIPDDVDRSKLEGKPDVVFDTFFPHPGNYRIWSQFQRGDKIITVPFTIYVPRMK